MNNRNPKVSCFLLGFRALMVTLGYRCAGVASDPEMLVRLRSTLLPLNRDCLLGRQIHSTVDLSLRNQRVGLCFVIGFSTSFVRPFLRYAERSDIGERQLTLLNPTYRTLRSTSLRYCLCSALRRKMGYQKWEMQPFKQMFVSVFVHIFIFCI